MTEAYEDVPGVTLFPEEEDAVARAVDKRRQEFTTARACARAALASLGFAPVPIVRGPGGAPPWPPGVVGSLTHCAGYRGCAIGRAADVAAIGRRSDYIQDVIACAADDPRWAGIDHRHRVAGVQVPVSSIGGWYDIFLPGQLRDFRVLQQAGNPARLMIGPWTHLSRDGAPLQL